MPVSYTHLEELIYMDLPYTIEKEDDMYVVEGPKIEKMLGYTNLDSEKGFAFFQKFLKDTGILDEDVYKRQCLFSVAGSRQGDARRKYPSFRTGITRSNQRV